MLSSRKKIVERFRAFFWYGHNLDKKYKTGLGKYVWGFYDFGEL